MLGSDATPVRLLPKDDTGRAEHIHGRRRFDDVEDAASIAEKYRDGVLADIDWFELRYHKCTHDGDGGPCPGWEVATDSNGDPVRSGTVPDGV